VEEEIAVDRGHFGDPRLEPALVERPHLGGARHRLLGGVKKHRCAIHRWKRDGLLVDQVD